jgi:hypothetical protein
VKEFVGAVTLFLACAALSQVGLLTLPLEVSQPDETHAAIQLMFEFFFTAARTIGLTGAGVTLVAGAAALVDTTASDWPRKLLRD